MTNRTFLSCLLTLLTGALIAVGCAAPQSLDSGGMDDAGRMAEPGEEGLEVDEPLGPLDEPPPDSPKPPRPAPRTSPAPFTPPPAPDEMGRPKTAPPKAHPKTAPPKPSPSPASRGKAEQVAQVLEDLQDRDKADAAFRRLWTAPKSLIPLLIEEVENPAPSQVEQIQVLVVDPEFVGKAKLFLATRLRGLGKMEEVEEAAKDDWRIISQEYTKMSYGITQSKKHYRVLIEKYGGFKLGVVIRAGLMNRFRSTRYPTLDDDAPRPGALIEWWRQYYKRVSADLPPP